MKTARARAGDAAFNAGCVVFGVFMRPVVAEQGGVVAGWIYAIGCALLTGLAVWQALDAIILAIETAAKEEK